MKNYTLFAVILVFSFCCVTWMKCQQFSCHMKAIDKCMYPWFYLTHRPGATGIPPERKEFELLCKGTRKVFRCIEKYLKVCGTETFSALFSLVHQQMVNSMAELCKEGPMKQNFLKYSPCIHSEVKTDPMYKETCVNDLQAGLEYISNFTDVNDWVDIGCCSYNIWEDCIVNMTVAKCGVGGGIAITDLLDKGSGGILHTKCKRSVFDANSDWCKSKIPPPGTKAKGRFSNSVFSKYFSFICPNTGY